MEVVIALGQSFIRNISPVDRKTLFMIYRVNVLKKMIVKMLKKTGQEYITYDIHN